MTFSIGGARWPPGGLPTGASVSAPKIRKGHLLLCVLLRIDTRASRRPRAIASIRITSRRSTMIASIVLGIAMSSSRCSAIILGRVIWPPPMRLRSGKEETARSVPLKGATNGALIWMIRSACYRLALDTHQLLCLTPRTGRGFALARDRRNRVRRGLQYG